MKWCWLCNTTKSPKAKLVWPLYEVACKKVGLEPTGKPQKIPPKIVGKAGTNREGSLFAGAELTAAPGSPNAQKPFSELEAWSQHAKNRPLKRHVKRKKASE